MHLILCKACYRTSIVSAFSGDEQKQFEYATCGAYFFEKGEKKLRFQKHPDASVQGLTRKHVGLFAKHATINALSPLTLTFLRTLVSSNEETLPQFEDFFTAASLTLAATTLSISLLVFAKGISIHQRHQMQLLFGAIRQDSPPSKSANTKGPTFE